VRRSGPGRAGSLSTDPEAWQSGYAGPCAGCHLQRLWPVSMCALDAYMHIDANVNQATFVRVVGWDELNRRPHETGCAAA